MIKHKLPTIFIGIAAVSSLISQSLLDLFSILSIIMVLWIGFEKKMFKELFQKIGIEWAFIGFFITCFIGIVWNTGGFYWEHLKPLVKFNWMIHIYFMIAAFKLWMPKVEDALKLLLGLSLIPSVYAIASKFAGRDFLVPERVFEGRIVGMVNSATYHSHAAAILITLCAGLLFRKYSKYNRSIPVLILMWLMFCLSVYFTYTRGALLAIVFPIAVGLFTINWKKAVLTSLAVLAVGFLAIRLDPMLNKKVSQVVSSEKRDPGRIALFKAHSAAFLDHPILGMGYDAYKNSEVSLQYAQKHNVPEYLVDSHAHNQYLQLLSSTGLLGFFFFSAIPLIILIRNFKALGQIEKNSNIFFIATSTLWAQLTILVLFLTDQSFEYAKIRFVILAVWALAITSHQQSRSKAKLL